MSDYPRTIFVCALALFGPIACSSDPAPNEDTGADVGADAVADTIDADTSEVVCGDGVVDGPYEQCEPGAEVACADLGFSYGAANCSSDCIVDTSGCSAVPICGDGAVEGSEACDDGDRVDGDGCNADCEVERCGDGEVNGTEACDGSSAITCSDGTRGVQQCGDDCEVAGDTCLAAGVCGDGTVDAGEACDDGNGDDGDGCDSTCQTETCGDGLRQGQERCDGDDLGDQTCQSLGFDTGALYCTDACRLDTERCAVRVCGDGVLQPGEACDDGNRSSGDGCSRSCAVERCGDGLITIGEQCDGINVQGLTCADFGFALSLVSCGSDCRVDLSGCEPLPRCGDGTVDVAVGESCDDGNQVGNDGCSPSCVVEVCGDRVVQTNEACEPGIAPTSTCIDAGFVAGRTQCAADCTVDTGACIAPGCGNGLLDEGESCDGALTTAACLDEGYDFGRLDCTDECAFDAAGCRNAAMCGDGVRAGTEECDDGNMSDGDGCSLDCLAEFCGDGVVQPGLAEQCEGGGTAVVLGCGSDGQEIGTVVCDECGFDPIVCFDRACGNGVIEIGESCDDGNRIAGDGCDTFCVSETCGDGTHQPYEACDGGPGAAVCADIGISVGTVGCAACAWDYGTCGDRVAVCGNGVHEPGEQCDAGAMNDDVADTCRTDCMLPRCGDSIVDIGGGETCDDGFGTDCPDYCVAVDDGVFAVPGQGTLSDALASAAELILVTESQEVETFSPDRELTIRGVGEGVTLSATDVSVIRTDAPLTLENLTIAHVGSVTAVASTSDMVVRNVRFAPVDGAGCLVHSNGILDVQDSEFVGCQRTGTSSLSSLRGGAIRSADSASVNIERTLFDSCGVTGARLVDGGSIGLLMRADAYTVRLVDLDIRDSSLLTTAGGTRRDGRGSGIDIQADSGTSTGLVMIDGLTMSDSTLEVQSDEPTSRVALGGALSIELTGGELTLVAQDVLVTNTSVRSNPLSGDCYGGVVLTAVDGGVMQADFTDFEFAGNDVACNLGVATGGGLYVEASGAGSSVIATLNRGLVVENVVTGTNDGGIGGGIAVRAVAGGLASVVLTNVTLTDNSADQGGGVFFDSGNNLASVVSVIAHHVTVVGNDVTGSGGGIVAEGAGVSLQMSGSIIAENTIAGDNTASGAQCSYIDTPQITLTENNAGPEVECALDDMTDFDPEGAVVVAPLANNGSVLRTMLPLSGAVNRYAGCDEGAEGVVEDQRGLPRPVGLCDAGAAEAQAGE